MPAGILLLYLVAALTTLHAWQSAGFTLTGDEPHYLVIARGILVDHTLEQTVPYREAFAQGLFFGGASTEPPTPANTHAYLGPNGLFNIHNVGLPLLIALPYGALGVVGVKVFLVLVGGVALILLWKISGVFVRPVEGGRAVVGRTVVRAVTVGAVGLGMPLLPGANQVFPDIPAGVLCLVGLYGVLTVVRRPLVWREVLTGIAVGYLPLLQIKFALPALVLVVSLAVAIVRRETAGAPPQGAHQEGAQQERRGNLRGAGLARGLRRAAAVVVPFVVLLGILFDYNLYAFSNLTGPYDSGAFEVGPAALMSFEGLVIDQNQGLLFQSPIAFAGLIGAGLMFARRRCFTLAWVLVLLALLVPNALLANEYGGYSLNGRFQWPAALVFAVATIFALGRLAAARPLAWAVVSAVGLAVSAGFWALLTLSPTFLEFGGRLLYRQDPLPWLLEYSVFYFPLQNALPALYDPGWAAGFPPNTVWAVVVLVLLVVGFAPGIRRRMTRRLWMPVAATLATAVVVAGLVANPPTPPRDYPVSQLVVLQGSAVAGGVSVSRASGQEPGTVTEGPITLVRAGTYTVSVTYRSAAPSSVVVGSWQALPAHADATPPEPLAGTGGEAVTVSRVVELTNVVPATLQVRTSWYGVAQLTVLGATFRLD